jgi:hypothetical protein
MAAKGPKVLWPLVLQGEPSPKLTDEQFTTLEKAGRISLTENARRALQRIADGWTAHDRALRSPRPAEFRVRLRSMRASLERASAKTDLLGPDAPALDQPLYHWLLDQGLPGTNDALNHLAGLAATIEFLKAAEKSLPADSGSARPMDESRFIQYLADQFEACGGVAKAYATIHTDDGYAKTKFRDFVHEYYRLLPLKSRRTRSGLDGIICDAVTNRRKR